MVELGKATVCRIWVLLVTTSFTTVHFSGAQLVNENEGVNSKVEECSSPYMDHGLYEKISPSSKYMVFRPRRSSDIYFSAEDAETTCSLVPHLESAEVTSVTDLMSLEQHVNAEVWIGLNHIGSAGKFMEAGGRPIQFQSFTGMEPNNEGNVERCIMLKPKDGFLSMADASCFNDHAGILCQFKRDSHCFLQSAEETADKTPDELESLETEGDFFISTQQKNWEDANDFCLSKGQQLVVLTDDDSQALANGIKKRLAQLNYNPATQFWTAGIFADISYNELKWQVGEDLTIPAGEDLPLHEWASGTEEDKEPLDQSATLLENCLDVSFENIDMENVNNYGPLWRASNCFLPKYFICKTYKFGSSQEILEEATTESANTESEPESGGDDVLKCDTSKMDPVSFEIDLTKALDENDIVKMMIFNVEHNLKSGLVPLELKEEIKWKGEVIDLIAQIAKKSVDTDYIDHGMINVVKIIFLMYLNAAVNENSTRNMDLWTSKFIPHLKECLENVTTLPVLGSGFEVTHVQLTDADDVAPILVPEEYADLLMGLDSVIDIVWYMFSLCVAQGYHIPANRITFASDFHVIFIADFIDPLREKWTININLKTNSTGLDYTLALGDVDYKLFFRNLRFIVSAAYMKHQIVNLELVRPLNTMQITDNNAPYIHDNARTGNFRTRA